MPGISCAVAGCRNSSTKTRLDKDQKISYHSFPKDKSNCDIWAERCCVATEELTINLKYARICSNHFMKEDFERDLQSELMGKVGRPKLKKDVLPTLNLPNYKPPPQLNVRPLTDVEERKRLVEKLIENSIKEKSVLVPSTKTVTKLSPELNNKLTGQLVTYAAVPKKVFVSSTNPSKLPQSDLDKPTNPGAIGILASNNTNSAAAPCQNGFLISTSSGAVLQKNLIISSNAQNCSNASAIPDKNVFGDGERVESPQSLNCPKNVSNLPECQKCAIEKDLLVKVTRLEALLVKRNKQRARMQKQYMDVRKMLLKKKNAIVNLGKNLTAAQLQIKSLKKELATFTKKKKSFELLNNTFTPSQIKVLMGKRKVTWGDQDFANAFALRSISKRAYLFLKDKLKYPLPSFSTLKRYAATALKGIGEEIDSDFDETETPEPRDTENVIESGDDDISRVSTKIEDRVEADCLDVNCKVENNILNFENDVNPKVEPSFEECEGGNDVMEIVIENDSNADHIELQYEEHRNAWNCEIKKDLTESGKAASFLAIINQI